MKFRQEPLVSVITPVYNGEPYLRECIEGVLAQTYSHWQYIIVNNCSTDRSLELAKAYAKVDSRITVVDNESLLDQISNFNRSATLIPKQAKYCKFAFADDLLFPTCIEQMVQIAELDPEVSIVSCYVTDGVSVPSKGVRLGTNSISGREACRLYLLHGVSPFSSFNGLLFRADVVRRRYPFQNYNDGFFEDADVCFDILRNSKLGFVHQILAFHRSDNVATFAKIEAFNPWLLTELLFLHRYGGFYLSSAEFERRWNEKTTEYQLFLARSVLVKQDSAFWKFHNRGIEQMGPALNKSGVAWKAVLLLLDRALNPKASIEKMFAKFVERWRSHVSAESKG
jgi:glycosyltransferase involved in cell wall biosynthesis